MNGTIMDLYDFKDPCKNKEIKYYANKIVEIINKKNQEFNISKTKLIINKIDK